MQFTFIIRSLGDNILTPVKPDEILEEKFQVQSPESGKRQTYNWKFSSCNCYKTRRIGRIPETVVISYTPCFAS